MATSRSSSSLLAGTKYEARPPARFSFATLEPMPWPSAPALLAPLAPWFDANRREMPWRARDLDAPHPDPYAVMVSEFMLQQTQVATVIPYFERWMRRFPDAETLAGADEDTLHKAWEGLGYYRRARLLHGAARSLAAEGWPADLPGLLALPGLGPYTAAAVGAIAFQWPTPALDGNAFRVLARLLILEGDPKVQAGPLREWLAPALAALGPSRLTQALMELGATVCVPQPRCGACPLAKGCGAHQAGRQTEIPPAAKRTPPRESDLWLLAIAHGGAYLLHPPAEKGLLAGLWRWPVRSVVEAGPEGPLAEGLEARAFPGWTQVYTHRRERVRPLLLQPQIRPAAAADQVWVEAARLPELPMGKRDARLRDLLEASGDRPLTLPAGLLGL